MVFFLPLRGDLGRGFLSLLGLTWYFLSCVERVIGGLVGSGVRVEMELS